MDVNMSGLFGRRGELAGACPGGMRLRRRCLCGAAVRPADPAGPTWPSVERKPKARLLRGPTNWRPGVSTPCGPSWRPHRACRSGSRPPSSRASMPTAAWYQYYVMTIRSHIEMRFPFAELSLQRPGLFTFRLDMLAHRRFAQGGDSSASRPNWRRVPYDKTDLPLSRTSGRTPVWQSRHSQERGGAALVNRRRPALFPAVWPRSMPTTKAGCGATCGAWGEDLLLGPQVRARQVSMKTWCARCGRACRPANSISLASWRVDDLRDVVAPVHGGLMGPMGTVPALRG